MDKKKKPSAFIRNTLGILQRHDVSSIISWAQDGSGFIIHSLPLFQSRILPEYFKHQKYTSFVRQVRNFSKRIKRMRQKSFYFFQDSDFNHFEKLMQLNMYGFHKQKHMDSQNYFQHENFRRGDDVCEIKRKPERKKKCTEERILSPQKNCMEENPNDDHSNNLSQNNRFQNEKDQNQLQSPPKDELLSKRNIREDDQEMSSNSNCDENIGQICEQAIIQNQVLRTTDKLLREKCLQLKYTQANIHRKLRLKKLRHEQKQQQYSRQSPIQQQQLINNLSSAWQIIRAETLKLNLQLQMYLG